MRVTTHMLSETAKRAGITIRKSSMLDYINNDSSKNTLLKELNKIASLAPIRKSNYEKLEKEADTLLKKTEFFTQEGEKSVFDKARETGNKKDIYDGIKEMVESYNNTLKSLDTVSDTYKLNDYYSRMLKEAAADNSDELSNVGITIAEDKTLVINDDKLKEAQIDSLKNILRVGGFF